MKKNSCTQINPKKYSYYDLKQIHTRNLITKKFLRLENFPPHPPPHNFSNGPSEAEVSLPLPSCLEKRKAVKRVRGDMRV